MFLSKDALEKLATKRLLAYKKTMLKYPETGTDSWGVPCDDIISKQHPEWQEAYANIKAILATREHIEK